MRNWPTDPMRQHDRFIAAFGVVEAIEDMVRSFCSRASGETE